MINQDLFEEREHDGRKWLWVKNDAGAWKYLTKGKHYQLPTVLSEFVNDKKLVVQAGGHAGLYPWQYSKIFEKVVTLEPHPDNFYCLENNVKDSNVIKKNVAVGETFKTVSMSNPKVKKVNTGCFRIEEGNEVKMITIDSLNLEACSLIHLDLEGYELFALQGAIETIKKYKPVIVLETNDLCLNFNYSIENMNNWIKTELGYDIFLNLGDDTVYKPK